MNPVMSMMTSFKWDGTPVYWQQLPCHQLPSDLWRFKDIIEDRRPDYVLETGGGGGTTAWLQHICALIRHGQVFGIDLDSLADAPHYLNMFTKVHPNAKVMCILDSDVFNFHHMVKEIDLYAAMVTPRQFMVVCHTDRTDWGAGKALDQYMATDGRNRFALRAPPQPSICSYLERL